MERIIEYKKPIFKKGKDVKELTLDELKECTGRFPDYPPDTEDGKYLLISIPGKLKFCARKHLLNDLWLNFCDCLNLKIGAEKFIRTPEYLECLFKIKDTSKFTQFKRIINLALDKPFLLFKYEYNFLEFMKLCEVFGEEYGSFSSIEELEKPLEFYANFYFNILNQRLSTAELRVL